MGDREREPESVASIAGFALGISTVMAAPNLSGPHRPGVFPAWLGFALAAAAAPVLVIPRLRRQTFLTIFAVTFIPVALSNSVARTAHLAVATGDSVRGIGVLVSFAASFLSALWFARQKRELDLQVFTRSATFAFFATVGVGVVYGVAQEYFGAPDLQLNWLALFGLLTFVIALNVTERRYS